MYSPTFCYGINCEIQTSLISGKIKEYTYCLANIYAPNKCDIVFQEVFNIVHSMEWIFQSLDIDHKDGIMYNSEAV